MRAVQTIGWILAGVVAILVYALPVPAQSLSSGLQLLIPDRPGARRQAPLVASHVNIDVAGPIARGTVRQKFVNPDGFWVEGIYVIPLPDDAAVDVLSIRVDDRKIQGVIREREQAQRDYAEARRSGQRASLLDQERSNVFTVSVANIPPGGEISVEIGWQQTLVPRDGLFSLMMPTLVAPRYIPPRLPKMVGVTGAPDPRDVPDWPRVTPPYQGRDEPDGPTVSFAVTLDSGAALTDLESASHIVEIESAGTVYRVALAGGAVPADRDFRLQWRPVAANGAAPALFVEQTEDGRYLLAAVTPPARRAVKEGVQHPREIIFVLDKSGSMDGPSIEQARESLRFALDRLAPTDSFNLIVFDDRAKVLFSQPEPASGTTVRLAKRYIDGLEADGGTEMVPALRHALTGPTNPDRLRQVVFITDGDVGNEEGLFRLIQRDLGDVRLFTVGIGSAPNGWFMRKAAELGRGSYTYVSRLDEVGARMQALLAMLESPVVTGIEVSVDGRTPSEMYPPIVPDLYAGVPVFFITRLEDDARLIQVSADGGWRVAMDVDAARRTQGVAKLWGRRRIEALEDAGRRGLDADTVRSAIVEVALKHGLVTRHTSLVAIDPEVVRPSDEPVLRQEVPLTLPEGWSEEKVLGQKVLAPASLRQPFHGPDTASPMLIHLLTGLSFAVLGIVVVLIGRRRMAIGAA